MVYNHDLDFDIKIFDVFMTTTEATLAAFDCNLKPLLCLCVCLRACEYIK
jgi:hypothetical protein